MLDVLFANKSLYGLTDQDIIAMDYEDGEDSEDGGC